MKEDIFELVVISMPILILIAGIYKIAGKSPSEKYNNKNA